RPIHSPPCSLLHQRKACCLQVMEISIDLAHPTAELHVIHELAHGQSIGSRLQGSQDVQQANDLTPTLDPLIGRIVLGALAPTRRWRLSLFHRFAQPLFSNRLDRFVDNILNARTPSNFTHDHPTDYLPS